MLPTLALTVGLAFPAEPLVPVSFPRAVDLVGTTVPADAWPPPVPEMPWPPAAGADAVLVGKWSAPLDRRLAWLAVAWTVLGDADATKPVASLTLKYADGRTFTEDVRLGSQITRLDAPATGPATPAVPLGPGRGLSLHLVRNPYPDASVASVSIDARQPSARIALLSVATTAGAPPFPVAPADAAPAGFPFAWGPTSAPSPQPAAWAVSGPAGAQGFVGMRDGHLAFANGGRVRFWGVNLLNAASLPPKDVAPGFADHLAGAGVNLVRIHHVDSPFAGLVRKDRKAGESPFDAEALDRLDFFVAELKKRGVYVLLEVATQRTFTEVDGVTGADPRVPGGHKLLPMFLPDWGDAYEAWTRAWLGRTNPYTGLRYADDPVVAMVELGNEHSLLVTWMSGGVEKLSAEHRAALTERWNAWLRARYGSDAAIAKAWTGSVNPGLQPGETLGSVRREPSTQMFFANWPEQRVRDMLEFHAELDRAFYARTARVVRELGYRVPLAATVTFHNPLLSEILADYDVVDTHIEWDRAQPSRNDALLGDPRAQNLLEGLGEAQPGRAFMVSEVSHSWPNDQTAEGPLAWATLASLQDWDALVWLNYANGPYDPTPDKVNGPAELRSTTTSWAQSAVASALFRSGALAPAAGSFTTWRSPEAVRTSLATGDNPNFPETRDVRFVLAHRLRDAYGPGPVSAPVPGAPGTQVGWWVEAATLVIDTDAVQAVVGRHDRAALLGRGEGAGPTRARGLEPRLDGFAAVSLVALDGQPLAKGGVALLTVAGSTVNDGMLRNGSGTTLLWGGDAPTRVTRPSGSVRFTWPTKPVVRPVAPDGTRGAPVPVVADGKGAWSLDMGTAGPTLWWEVASK